MDSPSSPLSSRADPAAWPTWWRYNRDAYLDLKRIVQGLETYSGDDGFTLGNGEKARRVGTLREEVVRSQVMPALQETLRVGGNFELIRSALLAMARVESSWGDAEGTTTGFLSNYYITEEDHQETAEASIVALGVRGDAEAAPLLIDLLLDTEAGREFSGQDEVDYRRRALAAYSLGLIGRANEVAALRRDIAMALIQNLEDNAFAPYDTQLAALVALGLVPMDACEVPEGEESDKAPEEHFCRGRQLALLLDFMVDQRRHTRLRAHAAVPLARLTVSAREQHQQNVTEWLLHLVQPRSKEAPEVKQAAVIAMGLIGDADEDVLDVDVRKSLSRIHKSGDRMSSALALIALARVGARPGDGVNEGQATSEVQELLLKQLARGRNGHDGWAAVALGVFAHTMAEHKQVVSDDVAVALRAKMARAGKAEDIAAPCIGLGLLRDDRASDVLLHRLARSKNEVQRASAALALGLVGAEEARDPMIALLEKTESDTELFRSLSLGLRLLGDRTVLERLVEAATEAEDDAVRSSLHLAMGALGDAAAIEPLVAAMRDDELPDDVRASAARALGELCDTATRPWAQAISTDLHHAVLSSTLVSYTGNGNGILDMR
jgi:HEAT repeat protein